MKIRNGGYQVGTGFIDVAMTNAEIASELGVTTQRAQQMVSRAMVKFAAALRERNITVMGDLK
jgi:DNA-directed RNA polymerase sigma subunit (sigma70/sigma32)